MLVENIRVWADGCFDATHTGHLRLFKLAKEQGDYLVVGAHSDEAISLNKGIPLTTQDERYFCIQACRWVGELVRDAPYVTRLETLDLYDIDFCVHGNDLTTAANGVDCYHEVKAAQRYEELPRIDDMSTSTLINNILCIVCPKLWLEQNNIERKEFDLKHLDRYNYRENEINLPCDCEYRFPTEEDKVIYIDGSFDLLHSGTYKALRAAKELGTYLIVGVHDDDIVTDKHGHGYPILPLPERVFGVLACKWVDACIPASPLEVTEDFLNEHGIDSVALGKKDSTHVGKDDPYEAPRRLEKLEIIDSESDKTSLSIVQDVFRNKEIYAERNRKKLEREARERAMFDRQLQDAA